VGRPSKLHSPKVTLECSTCQKEVQKAFFGHFFPLFSKFRPPLENMKKWGFRGFQGLSRNAKFS